ncbi:MAG TPA: DUF4270 domain-containing protein [Bacteroidales bacterium]|nr:DUF4270 domain-containing protein [Bacteroidales bacterium]HPS62381.1 DUF4270 domain-containing protein [Bacteroidales bacterium]
MNLSRYLRYLPLLAGFLILMGISSCKKDPYQIGFDLLPPGDTLHVKSTDTLTVEAFSVLQDSIRSDKTSTLLLGSVMDPIFGQTTAGFYSQVRLSSESADFGTNPVLDSLVLMLTYSGHYGDTLSNQRVKVYEISGDFEYDSLRYSNQHLETYPTLLADQSFVPRLSDSVSVWGEMTAPHLRINLSRLTSYLGRKILEAPEDVLSSNTAFLKFFKGLYVTVDPVTQGGVFLNFSISSGKSKLVAYFHNGNDPEDDSLHFDMYLSESCARFIHTDHGGYIRANPDLKQQVLNRDSARGTERLFLQGMGGVKIKLKFPYLKNFAKGQNIAINDAVLRLKNVESDTNMPPPSLYLYRQDSIGRVGYLVDEGEGSSYFGGTYDADSRTYFFRLTQHFQKVLTNGYPYHYDLYLMVNTPVNANVTPNRIMLFGTRPEGATGNDKVKLTMTYTIQNQ